MRKATRLLALMLFCGLYTIAQAPPAGQAGGGQPAAQAPAAGDAAAKAARKAPTLYRVQAGDFNGDGKAEIVAWDSESKELAVFTYASGTPEKLTAHAFADFPNIMRVADVDGDGKEELLVGEGLRGYNPKQGPQTDVRLTLCRPFAKDWAPVEIFRAATERPQVTSLQVADLDGDGKQEILFGYFSSTYFVDLAVARRRGAEWAVEKLPRIRMAMSAAAGDAMNRKKTFIAVGRPYGEDTSAVGGAFLLEGETRIEMPAFRGVSSIAVGDVDGDGRNEVVVGDGWHRDYGKIARARLAVMRHAAGKWDYELIEDVPELMRITEISLVDLDGDKKPEIVAFGERKSSLGGDVRVYQRTRSGWRGMTAAKNVQSWAIARSAKGNPALVLAGSPPTVQPIDLRTASWDVQLAEAVNTYEVEAAALVGKPAPRLQGTEWVGSQPLSLESLQGKVVVVDFWATWCKPCIKTFPVMREWLEKYSSRGLVIVGVTNHSSQTSQQVRAFVEKDQLPWPVVIDPADRTHMDYGVSPLPHTFLIDRKGVIRATHVGGGELAEIEKQIIELLSEPQ